RGDRLCALLVAGVLVAATGCGATPTPGLSNGSVSACYRAIPTARHAIHDPHATVIGVHRIPADRVKSHLPPSAQSLLAGDNDTTVCAVAFHGKFVAGQVDLAPTAEAGNYAVVLVSSKKLQLIDSAVLNHLPRFLGRRFV
ncbi:MAG TPA: hypothetical protein VFV02_10780, partial [Acidimicrobiales bacterium]|nr:hypothetical protein [Acidimicrobiales bacterium]